MKTKFRDYIFRNFMLISLLVVACTEREQKETPERVSDRASEEPGKHRKLSSRGYASHEEQWKTLNKLISSNADTDEISEKVLNIWRSELITVAEMDEPLPLAVDAEGNDQIPREAFVPELNHLDSPTEDRLKTLSALACTIGPATMFSLFDDRHNSIPVTWVDVATFRAIESTLEELVVSDPAGARSLAAEYAESKNPVYRYLALVSTGLMLPGENPTDEAKRAHSQELLPLYNGLVDDSDPLIQNEVYDLIGTLGSEEGLSLLEQHLELASTEADPRRRLAIRRALETNRSLLKASQLDR